MHFILSEIEMLSSAALLLVGGAVGAFSAYLGHRLAWKSERRKRRHEAIQRASAVCERVHLELQTAFRAYDHFIADAQTKGMDSNSDAYADAANYAANHMRVNAHDVSACEGEMRLNGVHRVADAVEALAEQIRRMQGVIVLPAHNALSAHGKMWGQQLATYKSRMEDLRQAMRTEFNRA